METLYIETNLAKQAGGFYCFTKLYANEVPAINHWRTFVFYDWAYHR